ncbi:hypothetical protein [Bacillus toyonensis]|uniref:hypothetical protein n=1 Tax=Bacillus toyonensis TaxID=155322 RepID=UPI000BF5927C|nr:hypothetical protein [Bacillus toyonensis]PGF05276.1 hypothetical protein COM61_02370 [Bacillus toyonensis]
MEILNKYDELGFEVTVNEITTIKKGEKIELAKAEIKIADREGLITTLEAPSKFELRERLENWLAYEETTREKLKELPKVRFVRFATDEHSEYSYSTIMIRGDITNEEFLDLYHRIVKQVGSNQHERIARAMCHEYGFQLVEEDLEIHAMHSDFDIVDRDVKYKTAGFTTLG